MFGNSKLKKIGSVWLFVLPAFIPLMVFWIYPILKSLYISFTDWDYMSPTYNFVFLDNFIKLFKDSRFYEALGTTVWFSIGTLFPHDRYRNSRSYPRRKKNEYEKSASPECFSKKKCK